MLVPTPLMGVERLSEKRLRRPGILRPYVLRIKSAWLSKIGGKMGLGNVRETAEL